MEYTYYYYAVWAVYLILIFYVGIAFYKKSYMQSVSNGVIFIFMSVFFLFGTIAVVTSDWDSYVEIMKEQILYTGTASTNLEGFWVKVMLVCKNNIYLFRSMLYSMIYLLFYFYIIKYVPTRNRYLYILLYILMGLYLVSGGRQFLSVCLFYISFEFFLKKKYYISFPLFAICCLLHKGAILYIPSIVFLLINPRLNKLKILLIIALACVVSIFVQIYLADFMDYYFSGYSHYANFDAKLKGSRRIYYAYQLVYFLYAAYLLYLIYILFKYSNLLSKKNLQYRNFLFANLIVYFSMCAINLSYETTQRFLGIMLFIPVILLSSILIEKNVGGAKFRRITFFTAGLFALAANISISGVIGIYM